MKWVYRKLTDGVQGRGLAEDNFANETVSSEQILVREVLQNSLDARLPNCDGPVKVSFRLLGESPSLQKSLGKMLPEDYRSRLQRSVPDSPYFKYETPLVLIIEDFETTGLNGYFQDACQDGANENWNGFWFREGEGAKGNQGSNGRAGQGKVTYYRLSQARCVFGLTVRSSDSKRLLMGRSSFRRSYWFPEDEPKSKYDPYAFWCDEQVGDEKRWPTEQEELIEDFIEKFCLARSRQSGLSLVIPYPQELKMKELLRACLLEFYIPIICSRILIQIEEVTVDAKTVNEIFKKELTDEMVIAGKSVFSQGYRDFVQRIFSPNQRTSIRIAAGWENASGLEERFFPEDRLAEIRRAFSAGALISVEFPLTVQRQREGSEKKESVFAVHLQFADDLKRPEEAYLRGDLLIAHEKHLSGQAIPSKVRAITHISHPDLSALLAEAEEPTHLKWNGSKPRLIENYRKGKQTVSAVRNALPRLLRLIEQGTSQKNTKALASFFAKPNSNPGAKQEGKGSGDTSSAPDIPILPQKRRSLSITTTANTLKITSSIDSEELALLLPIIGHVEVFLLELDGASYDPFDLDFSDGTSFQIKLREVDVTMARRNRIEFRILKSDFEFAITGFDPNVRMKAKVDYMENGHAQDISEE